MRCETSESVEIMNAEIREEKAEAARIGDGEGGEPAAECYIHHG